MKHFIVEFKQKVIDEVNNDILLLATAGTGKTIAWSK